MAVHMIAPRPRTSRSAGWAAVGWITPALCVLGPALGTVARAADCGGSASLNALLAANHPIVLAALSAPKIGGDVNYSSDTATALGNQIQLSDNVIFKFADREVHADKATYDRDEGLLTIEGKVVYTDPDLRVQGSHGSYSDSGAAFSDAQFQFLKQPGHGTASSITFNNAGTIELMQVTYTSCPPDRADWLIRARELTLDTDANRGVARGARVEFEGIPLIYLPWLSFPLSTARQTGFLFPTLGSSSRSGAILGVPWYWNIAPNQDLTLTPTTYTNRGLDLGAQYRFLSNSNRGTVDANFMPHDSVVRAERSYEHVYDRLELAGNWRLTADAENVSDTAYFEDFAQGSQATSTAFLARSLEMRHRDDIWNVSAMMLNFQTLDENLALADRPYTVLPRIDAAAQWPLLPGLRGGFTTEFADFTRAVGVTGARLDMTPSLQYELRGAGYYFRPSVAWDVTQYSLDSSAVDRSPARSVPIVSVDTGLTFERLAGSHGTRSYTLEPRLMYVYIPYRDQSQLPVFDTAVPDPNLIELFRPNRYVGLDRIGDAHEVIAGLTTRMFESASGIRYLSATVGHSFLLEQPRVTLPSELPDTSLSSAVIAEVDLAAYRNWNLQFDMASNQGATHVERTDVQLQYRPNSGQVANLGYRFQSGTAEQAEASIAWPISHRWDAYGRAVYSVQDHESIEDFAGFQYRGDCWGVRTVVRRSVSTRTGERDTGFYLQLELTGLSNVGTGADAFLERSIRGYSATSTTR
jgi:LPS-assembly protein